MKFFEKINKKLALIIFVVMIVISIAGVAVYGIVSENMRNIEVANKKLEENNNSNIKVDSNGNPVVVALDEPILDDDVLNNGNAEGETTMEEKQEEKKDNNNTNQQQSTPTKSTTPYYIKVNIQANVVTIYKKDANGEYTVPVKAMICSTGEYTPPRTSKYPGTVYKMPGWRKEAQSLQGGVIGQYATQITGNILFHSVPYTKCIDGTKIVDKSSLEWWEYDKLGTYASAGCIRLTVADAKWIYNNVGAGTIVEFYSSSNPGPLGKPQTKKISSNIENRGWDPTDPDPSNPWKNVKQEEKKEEKKNENEILSTNTEVTNSVDVPNTNTENNNTNTEINNTNTENHNQNNEENNKNNNVVINNNVINNNVISNNENTVSQNTEVQDKQNVEKHNKVDDKLNTIL